MASAPLPTLSCNVVRKMKSHYKILDPDKIIKTTDRLHRRITERFPASGLSCVAGELTEIARDSAQKARQIAAPAWSLRIILAIVLILWTISVYYGASLFQFSLPQTSLAALLGWLEAAMNIIVSIGVAIWFLITLEGRYKRAKALAALNELRSIAHVIDMHQLTKDPSLIGSCEHLTTSSSPKRDKIITEYQMMRYLDYCTELLSIVGKLAAVYAQYLPSGEVITAVNEVENLSTDLSRKVWQKIMMLHKYDAGA